MDAESLRSFLITMFIIWAVTFVFYVIVMWKIYEKAGQPGWASIVPFYNYYVLLVYILGMPSVWFWLLLVPCVNYVVLLILAFMVPFKLAEKFGKSAGFAVGLLLLGIIFYPILAFGDAQYQGGRRRRREVYEDDDDEDEGDRPRRGRRDNW
jgi:hypothetical protein